MKFHKVPATSWSSSGSTASMMRLPKPWKRAGRRPWLPSERPAASPPLPLGKPNVKRNAMPAPTDDAKNADFPAKTTDQGQRGRSTKMKSRQDVADLTNPELPRLNRFSNHGLHSDVLTQIHDMPGPPAVTSLGR